MHNGRLMQNDERGEAKGKKKNYFPSWSGGKLIREIKTNEDAHQKHVLVLL